MRQPIADGLTASEAERLGLLRLGGQPSACTDDGREDEQMELVHQIALDQFLPKLIAGIQAFANTDGFRGLRGSVLV
jgi:hypothetical protein